MCLNDVVVGKNLSWPKTTTLFNIGTKRRPKVARAPWLHQYIYIERESLTPLLPKAWPPPQNKIKTQPKEHHTPNLTKTISQRNPNNNNHILKIKTQSKLKFSHIKGLFGICLFYLNWKFFVESTIDKGKS